MNLKLSLTEEHSFAALVYLASNPERLVMGKEIANNIHIPLGYLLKILLDLSRADILKTKRGPTGGFMLVKKPEEISLLKILEAISGPLTTNASLDDFDFNKVAGKHILSSLEINANLCKEHLKNCFLSDLL